MAEFSTVALQACTKQADQLRAYLQNQVRLDGRGLVDHRKTLIRKSQFEFGDVVGSSRVQVGGTIIICGINLLVGTPCLAHPSSGDVGKIHGIYSNQHNKALCILVRYFIFY